MITSASNPQIKHLVQLQTKRKARDEEGVFICEGRKLFEELSTQRPGLLRMTYVAQGFYEECMEHSPEYFQGIPFELVQDSVFREASQTVTPQGILAVAGKPEYCLEQLLKPEFLRLVILENLQDPGNLGTIIRTAEGAGMDGIILTKGSVDIFNPKVIRSTMGSVFRVPFLYTEQLPELLLRLREEGIRLYAAHLKGAMEYDQMEYADRSAFLIGNEANGLSGEAAGLADYCIKIPMAGMVESLNAAVAAALIMYQARK